MKNSIRTRIGLAVVLTVGLAGRWAAEAQGQDAASPLPLVVSPAVNDAALQKVLTNVWPDLSGQGGVLVDEAALQRVLTNGQGLLAKAKWRTTLPSNSALNLFATNRTLYCYDASRNGRDMLSALDTESGRVRWETAAFDGTPVVTEGGVELAGVTDGQLRLVRFAADTGAKSEVWQTIFLGKREERLGILRAAVSIAGQQVVAAGGFQRIANGSANLYPVTICSFDRRTGKEQWSVPVAEPTAIGVPPIAADGRPIAADGRIYMPLRGDMLVLEAATGRKLWQSPPVPSPSTLWEVHGSTILRATQTGDVFAYAPDPGRETWRETWHSVISPNTAAAPSWTQVRLAGLTVQNGRVLVTVYPLGALGPGQDGPLAAARLRDTAGIALFALQNGKPLGYFNGITAAQVTTTRPGYADARVLFAPKELQEHKGLLVGQSYRHGCVGIESRTLRLEWYIPGSAKVVFEGVLYVNTRQDAGGNLTFGAEIAAIPLAAWEELRAAK